MDAWRTSTGVAAAFASCSPFTPSAFADAHGLCTDAQRTGNGHQTGGGRAGIRTHNGLQTDSDTDWERTLDGLLTGGHWSDLDESSYSKMGGGTAAAFHAAR